MTDNQVLRLQAFDIHRLVNTLPVPAPTDDTAGEEMPTISGSFRVRRIALIVESDQPGAVVNGPVSVHAFAGGRWRNVGTINAGANINAEQGFEVEIPWSGAERIAVSALSVSNGPVTIGCVPLEVQ